MYTTRKSKSKLFSLGICFLIETVFGHFHNRFVYKRVTQKIKISQNLTGHGNLVSNLPHLIQN